MNLVLDTQTWIYLANGYNQTTGKTDEGLHFHLMESMMKLVNSGKLKVLVNEVLFIEWDRNKHVTRKLIETYKNRIDTKRKEITSMKKILSPEKGVMAEEILAEFIMYQESLIKKKSRAHSQC